MVSVSASMPHVQRELDTSTVGHQGPPPHTSLVADQAGHIVRTGHRGNRLGRHERADLDVANPHARESAHDLGALGGCDDALALQPVSRGHVADLDHERGQESNGYREADAAAAGTARAGA